MRTAPTLFLVALLAAPVAAAELRAATVAAFDRYVRATEARMDTEINSTDRFIRTDRARKGELLIERLTTTEAGKTIDVPGGLIHHWLGMVFVPGVTVDQSLALLQDYNRHTEVYRPAVARSKVLARDGDVFRVYLRFFMKKVIAVVVNTENEARFTRVDARRAYSRIYSTRIAEVENPDTPREREKPVGNDTGYMWRLYTYWRFLEADGGTYIQCESISLTRGIPTGFGWLIGPFVTGIPRESLTFTLETTRATLTREAASRKN
jgi:hypothetical protein